MSLSPNLLRRVALPTAGAVVLGLGIGLIAPLTPASADVAPYVKTTPGTDTYTLPSWATTVRCGDQRALKVVATRVVRADRSLLYSRLPEATRLLSTLAGRVPTRQVDRTAAVPRFRLDDGDESLRRRRCV